MAEKFKVHVVPNAPRSECAGAYADAVKIKIAAQAVDGKANAELIKFLAKKLGVPKSDVKICSGLAARDKIVEVEGCADSAKKLLQ